MLAGELRKAGRCVVGTSSSVSLPGCYSVDYGDPGAIRMLLRTLRPREIFHLACPSKLEDSAEFQRHVFLLSVNVTLEFLRWIYEESPATRFFFASSSEIYGDPVETPQSEVTTPRPTHPYAIAKLAGQQLVEHFRRHCGVFGSTGILFNHESHLRREDFASRRITRSAARISLGMQAKLELGNLDAVRDWSDAADFVRGFRLALEAAAPEDYVFASGCARPVRELVDVAFSEVGLKPEHCVDVRPDLFRPDFTNHRKGDASKAQRLLGWRTEKPFEVWVREMVRFDLNNLRGKQ